MRAEGSPTFSAAPVVTLDVTTSTNAEALERARGGERGPLWITANAQSAGRGRHGRPWVSPPGNLYASLLLTDPASQQRAAELSFVAALALHDAISQCAPVVADGLKLKWPNDLLLNGAKLVGILIQAEGGGAKPLSVVVGLGVNCSSHPLDAAYRATDLGAAGAPVAPDTLFEALRITMAARLAQWARGDSFPTIRRDWLQRAGGLGAPIRVRTGKRDLDGIFADLDPHGRIVVALPNGANEIISAGEVFPLESASA